MRREVVRTYEEIGRILHVYHSSQAAAHKGINDVVTNISRVYFWRNIRMDVTHYVRIAGGISVNVLISSNCL